MENFQIVESQLALIEASFLNAAGDHSGALALLTDNLSQTPNVQARIAVPP
jgi:hypothetical protein